MGVIRDAAKSLALTIPPIRRLYEGVLAANTRVRARSAEIGTLRSELAAADLEIEKLRSLLLGLETARSCKGSLTNFAARQSSCVKPADRRTARFADGRLKMSAFAGS